MATRIGRSWRRHGFVDWSALCPHEPACLPAKCPVVARLAELPCDHDPLCPTVGHCILRRLRSAEGARLAREVMAW